MDDAARTLFRRWLSGWWWGGCAAVVFVGSAVDYSGRMMIDWRVLALAVTLFSYEPPAPKPADCVTTDIFVAMERYQNYRIDALERKFSRTGPYWHVPPGATLEIGDRWAALTEK